MPCPMTNCHPGCKGPLKPKVIQSTDFDKRFPASSVLFLGETGDMRENDNFWLAERFKTIGQGFTLKLDNCTRIITGCLIKNLGLGSGGRATKKFKVSGSLNKSGPWKILVQDQLSDTRRLRDAQMSNFTFGEPVEIQFLKFDLVSYWGHGAGLQYFAPIPATSKEIHTSQGD